MKMIFTACLLTGLFFSGYAQFAARESLGIVDSGEIREASGLVASSTYPGFFWTHNDSGDAARIFLLDSLARHRSTWYLPGVKARDWEEMGKMRRNDVEYLMVGDIGDNRAQREYITMYVFPEPVIELAASEKVGIDSIVPEQVQVVHLQYEDGARDAEAFFYDDQDELLYVITKRELQVGVYSTPLPGFIASSLTPSTDTLKLQLQLRLPTTWVTGADISARGDEILIKNLLQVLYWQREAGESVIQAFQRPASRLPYRPEPQGEAIGFAADGQHYYTISESLFGFPVHLFQYPRKRNLEP